MTDIDPNTALATITVANFMMPFVKMGAEKIAEKLTDSASESVATKVSNLTKQVWDKVTGIFSSDRDKGTLQDFEEMPEQTADLLIAKLAKKLEANTEFAEELRSLVEEPIDAGSGNSTGAQIMNAHVASIQDFRNANFSHSKNVRITGIQKSGNQSVSDQE